MKAVTDMVERGCVVISLSGRDKGRLMAVLRTGPDGLWLADGRRRRVEAPKRKNPRHAALAGCTVSEAAMATNRELRRALAALTADPGARAIT